jgi:general secretion pathway protein B
MSLILDALNRAEHERKNQNAVPDLNTLHRPQEIDTSSEARRTLWWVIGVVLVLIAIIVVLVMLLRREPAVQISGATVAPVQQPAITPSAQPVFEQKPSAGTTPTAVVAAAPVVETSPHVSAPNAAVDRLYATEDPAPLAVADSGVSELYAAEAATAAVSETIVDPFNASGNTAAVSATAQEQAPPRTFDSIKNIPDFNALPWNMRQQIPTISYARHNYLANGVSSVVINNQTTGVGNIIGTGQFVVQEIYVDGVVLKHGNAVFKLRALNGWINM